MVPVRTWQVEQEPLVFTPRWIHSHIQPIHRVVFYVVAEDLGAEGSNFRDPFLLFQSRGVVRFADEPGCPHSGYGRSYIAS